ncbi:hypothetical protein [Thermoanaerobacterium sp. RBIITD]|uniref:hypothetical protein n=1 Tax=Thermoanaerobacterium sp. RBIITD TaxID=1550240 RepID=UPI000BB88F43|nr:hypothetical protein [Thermoanaerobacterium sp. RBIITD]SNX54258.1 hypothetical protein SAMN05660242_1910 [Thermoanaerobacterium sp. RBIITD]
MKKLVSILLCLVLLMSTSVALASDNLNKSTADSIITVNPQKGDVRPNNANSIEPQTAYNYSIPNFYLVKGEVAWTTQSGIGFYSDGSDLPFYEDDFHISFKASGNPVNLFLGVYKIDDYVNHRTEIEKDPTKYVISYSIIYSAGDHKVNFMNLPKGKYVFLWKNMNSSNSRIDIANAVLTSY